MTTASITLTLALVASFSVLDWRKGWLRNRKEPREPSESMPPKEFSEGFLWGTSTASFQIEMGLGEPSTASDWWVWVHDQENIKRGNASGSYPEQGPGFWELYKEDLGRARDQLGNNAIRLSVDWARIFPKPTSKVQVEVSMDGHGNVIEVQVDDAAIKKLGYISERKAVERYRDIFAVAGRLGLTVFLTLYHWPLPLWLHDPIACRDNIEASTRRGWLDQETIVEYAKYSAFAADAFGDLVDLYATINEAPIMSKYGYLHETVHFPPGHSDQGLFLTVFKNLAIAHGVGYQQVKRWDTETVTDLGPATVGVVTVLEQYDPEDPENVKDVAAAEFNSYLWNEWNLNALITGDFDMNLDGLIDPEERMPHTVKGCDFIGADYYLRETVRHAQKGGAPRFDFEFAPSKSRTSDTGWEIYPQGLRNVVTWAYRKYKRPIYVTENGVADAEDKLRVDYLVSHLEQVHAAIHEDRVPVKGYFYWSLIDNYSWFSGYRSKFGLFTVDMKTKERAPTRGVPIYKQIATENRLPD